MSLNEIQQGLVIAVGIGVTYWLVFGGWAWLRHEFEKHISNNKYLKFIKEVLEDA